MPSQAEVDEVKAMAANVAKKLDESTAKWLEDAEKYRAHLDEDELRLFSREVLPRLTG